MTDRRPDFDELVGGDDLDPVESARLRALHDLLVSAGPPPDVSPDLRAAVDQVPKVRRLPLRDHRYRNTLIAAAAVAAVALFGGGYLVGNVSRADAAYTVPMAGSHGERAELVVYERDGAGNWPMRLRLEAVTLREGQVYELWLTKDGVPKVQCGSFLAKPGKTTVPLNAPYRLRQFDGWIVVEKGKSDALLWTVKA
ncbi:MAG: hypothetical protein FJW96_04885 [Actinobacteria bacterium]|nr:hypothetical protein [Actinomycetota bacterium]